MTITLDDLDTGEQQTRRDRWGRYLIVPPAGGKPKGYTRATTIAKALEDQHSLIAWKARVAAKGLTMRPELLKMIAVTDDRKRLDDLVEQAAQAGGATERRDEGTALHRALELHLGGQPVPELFRGDVDAVQRAFDIHGLSVLGGMTERICVLDEHTIAGTFDMIAKAGSTLYVCDFKTGKSLDYSGMAFATQLAIYAHADALYTQGAAKDGSQDRRDDMPRVDRAVALVVHVQPGSGVAEVHEVDIARGRRLLDLALEVRGQRSAAKTLIAPRASTGTAATSQRAAEPPEATPSAPAGSRPDRPPTRREELAERLRRLRAVRPEALALIATHWPDGVPAWNSGALYSRAEFDKIDALLATYEAAVDMPFTPVAQERLDELVPERAADDTPPPAAVEPVVLDEGDPVDAERCDALRVALQALTGPGRAWALQVLRDARDAGVPISLRDRPSERTYRISTVIERIAREYDGDDELARALLAWVLDDDLVQPGFATGAAFGAVDLLESDDLVMALDRVVDGGLVLVIDAQGTRLEGRAQPVEADR